MLGFLAPLESVVLGLVGSVPVSCTCCQFSCAVANFDCVWVSELTLFWSASSALVLACDALLRVLCSVVWAWSTLLCAVLRSSWVGFFSASSLACAAARLACALCTSVMLPVLVLVSCALALSS